MNAIMEAIRLCDENRDIPTYRRKRFEAYRLMAFLYKNKKGSCMCKCATALFHCTDKPKII